MLAALIQKHVLMFFLSFNLIHNPIDRISRRQDCESRWYDRTGSRYNYSSHSLGQWGRYVLLADSDFYALAVRVKQRKRQMVGLEYSRKRYHRRPSYRRLVYSRIELYWSVPTIIPLHCPRLQTARRIDLRWSNHLNQVSKISIFPFTCKSVSGQRK